MTKDPEAAHLWRSSFALAFVVLFAATIAAFAYGGKANLTIWQDVQAAATAAVVALVLWLQRTKPNPVLCQLAFAGLIASIIVLMTVNQDQLVRNNLYFFPVGGHKLTLLVIGILAPRVWLGLLSLLVVTLAATLQSLLFPEAVRHFAGEPLVTIVCAVVAMVLVAYRARNRAIERALAAARADAGAAQRIASTFLAVRDLANTPLQTLVLSVELLELERNGSEASTARIKRAITQLERLNEVLASEESTLRADWRALETFDAWKKISQRP